MHLHSCVTHFFLLLQEMQFRRSTARTFMYQACQTVSPDFRIGLQTQAIDLVNLQSQIDSVWMTVNQSSSVVSEVLKHSL